MYVTLVGRSSWAVINSLYSVLHEGLFQPDYIHIFVEDLFEDKVSLVEKGLRLVCEAYGFDVEMGYDVVGNAKFVNAGLRVNMRIKDFKDKGCRIGLDVTPGRKSLMAASLICAERLGVDHIFYLAVDEIEDIPFMLKPIRELHLRDFLKEVEQVNL